MLRNAALVVNASAECRGGAVHGGSDARHLPCSGALENLGLKAVSCRQLLVQLGALGFWPRECQREWKIVVQSCRRTFCACLLCSEDVMYLDENGGKCFIVMFSY